MEKQLGESVPNVMRAVGLGIGCLSAAAAYEKVTGDEEQAITTALLEAMLDELAALLPSPGFKRDLKHLAELAVAKGDEVLGRHKGSVADSVAPDGWPQGAVNFGAELSEWMEERQVGNRAVATRAGLSMSAIRSIRSGTHRPSKDSRARVLRAVAELAAAEPAADVL